MVREISNMDDVIDSRDVIARIEELEGERESLMDQIETYEGDIADEDEDTSEGDKEINATNLSEAKEALAEWDEDNGDELKALKSLAEDGANSAGDWPHGATLIRDSYFVDAMQELCEDIGDLPKDLPNYIVIDWEATACNLQADYSSVEFDGITYWVR